MLEPVFAIVAAMLGIELTFGLVVGTVTAVLFAGSFVMDLRMPGYSRERVLREAKETALFGLVTSSLVCTGVYLIFLVVLLVQLVVGWQ